MSKTNFQLPYINERPSDDRLKSHSMLFPRLVGPGIEKLEGINSSPRFQQNYSSLNPFSNTQEIDPDTATMLQEGIYQDTALFQKRLNNIIKHFNQEYEPFKPVSKDHLRANRVGVNVEYLEKLKEKQKGSKKQFQDPYRKERKSLDLSSLKKRKASHNVFGVKKNTLA